MKDVDFDDLDAIWSGIAIEDIERVSRIARRVLKAPAALLSSSVAGTRIHRFPSGDQQFLPFGTVNIVRNDAAEMFDEMSALPVLASFDAHLFASGHIIGTLSVFDRSPRHWSEDERATLADLADCLSELIVLRHMGGKAGADRRPAGVPNRSAVEHAPVETSTPIGEDGEAVPGSGSHILLADDLDLNRKLICDMLSLEGHVVDSVPDGAAAVRAAGEYQYDLILMDMIMPGMDGVTATRAIRALPAPACEVPIVALTAHSLPEQLESCLQAGMDATLVKPMTMDALTSAVATWTRTRRKAA